ncbi:hypothetical protein [Microbacterium sp. NPDC077486]|uniref:hypothetical protein n=1 Tax=Microbacterium sp. NPDC077486 TaxID=3154766 RepID=UPI00341CE162
MNRHPGSTATTGKHETVEELIRYAARVFEANSVAYPPAKMSKLIRAMHRANGNVRGVINMYVARSLEKLSWAGFELYTATGVADPTGARAAQNVDRERSAR